jgi:hypothetical protein
LLFPLVVAAQPREDIPLKQVSGTYTVKAMMPVDLDVIQLCAVRVDLESVIEYGCVDASPSVVVPMEITVVATPGIDAVIRVYAVDSEGLSSDYSLNAGLIDFTRPGTPTLVP